VLDAWLGGRDDLTVVGDANQTIYSFTGATPRYLLDFSRRFPDAEVVRLERDYRSTPQVVSLANRVIAAARGRMAGSKLHLVGQREPGPAPSFTEHPDEVAEAAAVAKKIKNLIASGTAASEIAVLYRINAQSEVYEEALTEAGVPFQVRGGEGFFSRQEIRQALLALQRAAERDVDVGALPEVVRAVLEPLGLTAEPPPGTKARERWEALTALAELVDEEVAQRPSLDLRALVTELRQRADARHPPVVQGVTLASARREGAGMGSVFLVGLADGTLPICILGVSGPEKGTPALSDPRGAHWARVGRWQGPGCGASTAVTLLNGIAPQRRSQRPRRPRGSARAPLCNDT
jgi:DNA helicase-2/ATP-dependent DNA helicase PcrA